jgi:hypothetical protein
VLAAERIHFSSTRKMSPSTDAFDRGLKPVTLRARKRRGRIIAIGDVHGCAEELAALIDRLSPSRNDRIILLGDLVNRGPDSRGVIALARKHAHRTLLGNHELRLLNYRRTDDPSHLKRSDYDTIAQLDESDWRYLEQMPLTYAVPEVNTVLVHGGFLPGRPWRGQRARIVTRIQVVGPDGEPHKTSEYPDSPHWSELWKGPPFVVYGHTPVSAPQHRPWSLGIDTDCARGGALTACILPGCELVQVTACRSLARAV